MHYLGIEAALKNQPLLDPAFIPFGVWRREYEKEASRPFALAVERDHGAVSVFETKLRGEDFAEANYRYIERFVKLLLWSAGGLRVWLCGDDALAKRLQAEYCPDGRRAFDVGFMQDVFEVPFEIVVCDWAHLPKPNEKPIRVGGHTNGCRIDLARAPLKYDGLRPWEILLSEAQERMTLAVPPAALDEFLALAKRMDVEATPLGEFTDDGVFHVTYNGKLVTHLDMEFMHDGVPQYQLNAVWEAPVHPDARIEDGGVDQAELLKAMLGRLNICSKEYLIRQYDHEVKGGSVVKPLTGVKRDGPSDAGVIRPILESEAGLVISHGICPKYSDYDAYWMMANAMDEGIRNAVAVGADPDRMAGVDNFCWCDPVQSEKTPDGEYKLAQLVRACKALSELCVAYGVPCISGKDSMKNDYTGGGKKISIPPTVLFSVLGIMDDVKKAVTSDFKKPGDRLYIIGNTARELAGSEIADQLGIACNTVPRVDAKSALASYRKLHQAINSRLISACHDLSDGGLAVSLAEMCIGGRLGAHLALNRVPVIGALTLTEALYSESASRLLVSVAPDKAAEFEALFGASAPFIGEVTSDARLTVASADSALFSAPVEALAHAFKATLDW